MAVIYDRVYQVPTWVVVDNTKTKSDQVISWFKEHDALVVEWPSTTFQKTLLSFKNKGWGHVFEEKTLIIPPQLLAMAVIEHCKANFGETSGSSLKLNLIHRLDRKIVDDSSYAQLFDKVLSSQDPVVLSHTFQIGEKCFDRERYNLWVSKEPVNNFILQTLAAKVVTIGNDSSYDVPTQDVNNKKELTSLLEEFFSN